MAIHNPVTTMGVNASGDSEAQTVIGGVAHTVAFQTGAIISQASLTLSASSQALPTPPTGAVRALLQTHGGTVTDRIYVSLDGNDATTADFFMKNVEDTTCLLYTSPSPRDRTRSRMPSSA